MRMIRLILITLVEILYVIRRYHQDKGRFVLPGETEQGVNGIVGFALKAERTFGG